MNRRKFCKILGLSAIAVAASPAKAATAVTSKSAGVPRCRISVLRCECFSDLQSRYLDDPESGPCTKFKCGEEFTVDRSNYDEFSRKFCPKAWDAVRAHVDAALSVGASAECGQSPADKAVIVCCPDGTRPVIFKVVPLNV